MEKENLKILAFVLARGGSTGVPGKNIKPIKGKPLLGYTLEIAKASKYINKIVVATDSPQIPRRNQPEGSLPRKDGSPRRSTQQRLHSRNAPP